MLPIGPIQTESPAYRELMQVDPATVHTLAERLLGTGKSDDGQAMDLDALPPQFAENLRQLRLVLLARRSATTVKWINAATTMAPCNRC